MRLLWLLLISTTVLTASARAQPGVTLAAQAPSAPEVESEASYRWQIATADTAALTVLLIGKGSGLKAAGAIYLLDGAVIHGIHGQPGRAAGSLALRGALPLIGLFAGAAIWWRSQDARCRNGDPDYCSDDEVNPGALIGFGLGLLTASVIDTALIARPLPVRKPREAIWAPRLSVVHDRVTLGVAARF